MVTMKLGRSLGPFTVGHPLGEGGMAMLRGIKTGLDPNNILCPGKLGLG